jgi:hypothetical protein
MLAVSVARLLRVEPLARLMRVWLDAVRRDLERAG